jgi:hypothetical protein
MKFVTKIQVLPNNGRTALADDFRTFLAHSEVFDTSAPAAERGISVARPARLTCWGRTNENEKETAMTTKEQIECDIAKGFPRLQVLVSVSSTFPSAHVMLLRGENDAITAGIVAKFL